MVKTLRELRRTAIIYVAPDCTDSAVRKRAHGLSSLGHALTSFSFRRDRYGRGIGPDWPNIELGQTTERKFVSRIARYVYALRVIYHHRRCWRTADVVYARNLDLALLTIAGRYLTGARGRLVYEVLDVHPALTDAGPRARLLRWLERRVLRRCDVLVLSSPAFLQHYFQALQNYGGTSFVLENKWPVHLVNGPRRLSYQLPGTHVPWNIGWFGNLRCRRSLDLLTQLADRLPDQVTVTLQGCASLLGEVRVRERVQSRPNMVYLGDYQAPDDLASVYQNIHFNWCADFGDGKNSAWLLPNRLYEGGYFGVPALAMADQETGRVVRARELGYVLSPPIVDRLQELLTTISADDYVQHRRQLESRPPSDFVDTGEIERLVELIVSRSTGTSASVPAASLAIK